MDEVIEVKNLVKTFGNFNAVDNISFSVNKGDIFGFLGVNGAGKSTTINMLCTLYKMTSGDVKICGFRLGEENEKIRNKIGVVFQNNCLDDYLTVKENLLIRGFLYESDNRKVNKNFQDIVEILNIDNIINKKYRELSGGQKRICDIGRALMNSPEILFLDEPTTGLDPKTRKILWKGIEELQKHKKMTIFLTTHYMEEAVRANNISIMNKGKIIVQGTPFEIKDKFSGDKLKIECKDKECVENILKDKNINFNEEDNRLIIDVKNTVKTIDMLHFLKANIESFEVLQGTMEDAFLNITGTKLEN